MSTPLKKLELRLVERFPSASVSVDAPRSATGTWWLDVAVDGNQLHVAWSPTHGFGISSDDPAAFGEGHDEVYPDLKEAWPRVQELLLAGSRTNPGIAGALRGLRAERHIPQTLLASRMDIQQAAVSKLERRQDMLLSTLRSFVTNLGGELELTVRFPDRTGALFARPSAKQSRLPLPATDKRRKKTASSGK